MNRLSLAAAAAAMVLVVSAMGFAGYWVLTHPGNRLTRLFSARITATESRVITGPYPLEADLSALKNDGVEAVFSLLDPSLPYERILLAREEEAVRRAGMRFRNFPMGSIFGRSFGPQYEENASMAADAVIAEKGKVYLHCYLGLHRVKVVSELVSKRGVSTSQYLLRQGQRSPDQKSLDRAQALYGSGRYTQALQELESIKRLDQAGRLLRAWTEFHMGRIAAACAGFDELALQDPHLLDAETGQGYCALRRGDNKAARRIFSAALRSMPNDVSARVGRGLARERTADLVGARHDLESALALEPGNAEAASALRRLQGPAPESPRR